MKLKLPLVVLISTLVLITSGCSIKVGGGQQAANLNDGGIWKSVNKGDVWAQKTLIANASGRALSFGGFDLYTIARDPADRNAMYISAINEGMLFTYDGGESWQRVGVLGRVIPRAITVDPVDHCTIYTAIDNKLYKSLDCARSWNIMYTDNDLNAKVNGLALDQKNTKVVYLATSRGDILKSLDGGASWTAIYRLKNGKFLKIFVSPESSRLLLAASDGRGLYRSKDEGATWESLEKNLKDFKDSNGFQALVFSHSSSSTVFLATKYGLLKSHDSGDSWTKIELLTADDKATINALAVSPKNDQEIYYVTGTTFYKTADGGKSWTTKKLPSTRAGWFLDIDPADTNVIYMGVRALAAR